MIHRSAAPCQRRFAAICIFLAQAGCSAGVDGLTWQEYETNLEDRLVDLHARVHRGAYRAQPSWRKFIPKGDGHRPLGVASLEDKIVQRAIRSMCPACFKAGARAIYTRVKDLMDTDRGLIGPSWVSLREAWFGEFAEKLIVVRYESLVRDPSNVIQRLYERLGETPFAHDFDNIEYQEEESDLRLGVPDLHTVKRKVEPVERATVLPPDIFMRYVDMSFWENEKLNTKKVFVL